MNFWPLSAIAVSSALFLQSMAGDHDPSALVALANRLCINNDGDHRATWQRATESGFVAIPEGDVRNLNLVGNLASQIRGLEKSQDGTTERVLTSALWIQAPDDGRSYFRVCWVSRNDENLRQVNRELQQQLGGRYFRAEQTFVYAWIPRPDGTNDFVPKRIFARRNLTLAREQGLRQLMVRQFGDSVFVGYISPRDEATYRDFDWSGPVAIPRPE